MTLIPDLFEVEPESVASVFVTLPVVAYHLILIIYLGLLRLYRST